MTAPHLGPSGETNQGPALSGPSMPPVTPEPTEIVIDGERWIACEHGVTHGGHDVAEDTEWGVNHHYCSGGRCVGRVPVALRELHAKYLAARQHTLSTDGMERDAAIEAQAAYVLGEAAELAVSCKGGTGGWGGVSRHTRCEIADVALSLVTLANILGVTVEDCIAEKTEEDRGRG